MLDDEREAFSDGYDTAHDELMLYPDGRRIHADSVTRRFSTGWGTRPAPTPTSRSGRRGHRSGSQTAKAKAPRLIAWGPLPW